MLLYGLIGYPLTHSFSKNYFTEKFKREGIDNCRYENFQLVSIDNLPKVLVENPNLAGLNVTIPHKESVLQFINESSETVKEIGACNCIRITDEGLAGYNTDVVGFEKSLSEKLGSHHRKALILGTGGAAKAVEYVLGRMGINYKCVSRQASATNLSYDQLDKFLIQEYELIINTTPVGMYPNISEAPPIPYGGIGQKHFLFDLIYNPVKTLFLKKGEDRGAVIQNGYDMLIYQAEESWNIWNARDSQLTG